MTKPRSTVYIYLSWLTRWQLNNLVKSRIVNDYPPLADKKGSYTAQFEHVGDNFEFTCRKSY